MPKILCVTTGLTGVLHASYKVVSLLKNAGYEVVYACPMDIKDKVQEQGIKYEQLDEIDFNPVSKVTEYKSKIAKLLNIKSRQKKAADRIRTEKFENLLGEFRPDLVLVDMELHDLIISSVSKNFATVLLSQWFSVWKNKVLPPLDTTILPNNNRSEIKNAWLRADLKQFLVITRNRIFTGFTDRASVLRQFAKTKGFPVAELAENVAFPPPFTYRTMPVISMTDWELEFPHEPRQDLFYVGSMVHENRKDWQIDSHVEGQLETIFEAKKRRGLKLIYCSLSTMHEGDNQFIKLLIEAVSNNKNWQLVISTGGVSANLFEKDLPDNVYCFTWVPQLKILAKADCSINHGGIHTINECIHFGVPMLIYSGKHFDQNGCAARVSFNGLGLMADKDSDDSAKIESRILEILENSSYRNKVMEIRFARSRNENKLIEVVEILLKSKKKGNQKLILTEQGGK